MRYRRRRLRIRFNMRVRSRLMSSKGVSLSSAGDAITLVFALDFRADFAI